MGMIDMNAYVTLAGNITKDVDFDEGELPPLKRMYSWRKHLKLHEWMAELYVRKGGAAKRFRCTPLRLTTGDLDELECAIRSGDLPPTLGLSVDRTADEQMDDDLEFIAKARVAIEAGEAVLYDSWW